MTFEEWWPTFRDSRRLADGSYLLVDSKTGYRAAYEAGASEKRTMPGSWMRIIQQVLDRVLAGEAAEQVVADYRDEYGHTIEGLERVEALRRELEALQDEVADWIGAGDDPSISGMESEFPAIANALAAWRVRIDSRARALREEEKHGQSG